nr:immunoglobulin heavy chain junction region [Macaca mulatta]MOV42295.1 immunoglobulin heavy chain junction region [Macaca mulatta]
CASYEDDYGYSGANSLAVW